MVGKTLKQIYLASQTKKTHTLPPLKEMISGWFVFHTPRQIPRDFLGIWFGLLQFGGSGSSTLNPPGRGISTRWVPPTRMSWQHGRMTSSPSGWARAGISLPRKPRKPKRHPNRSHGGLVPWGGLLGVMKLGPPNFFFGGAEEGKEYIHV